MESFEIKRNISTDEIFETPNISFRRDKVREVEI